MARYISFKINNLIRENGQIINLEDYVSEGEMSAERSTRFVHTSNRSKRARGILRGPLEVTWTGTIMMPQGQQAADFLDLLKSDEVFSMQGTLEGGIRRLIKGCVVESYSESDDSEAVEANVTVKATDLQHKNG